MSKKADKGEKKKELRDYDNPIYREYLKNKKSLEETFDKMRKIREEGKPCDVILKVKEKLISAHRVVLIHIPYFRVRFMNNMTENHIEEITLNEMEPDVVEALINFAYGGDLLITKANVESLKAGANELRMVEANMKCIEFLIRGLDKNIVKKEYN